MAKSKETVTVNVDGIRFEEYSSVRGKDYLQLGALAVMIVVVAIAVATLRGGGSGTISLTSVLILLLLFAALGAVLWGNLKKEYRKSRVSTMELTYTFNIEGWQVETAGKKSFVPWDKTYRVRKNDKCLLLYPSRKSTNPVPLRCFDSAGLSRVLAWAEKTAKKD